MSGSGGTPLQDRLALGAPASHVRWGRKMKLELWSRRITVLAALLASSGCTHPIEPEPSANPGVAKGEASGRKDMENQVIAQADQLLQAQMYREAEILLAREDQKLPGDFAVQKRLLLAKLGLARQNLASWNYVQTIADLDSAEVTLAALKQTVLDPQKPTPSDFHTTVKGHEDDLRALTLKATVAVTTKCEGLLTEADALAQKAYKRLGKNDRELIIEGLTKVRKCQEHGRLVGRDMGGRCFNSVRKLVSLVDETERDMILRAAGFEPLK